MKAVLRDLHGGAQQPVAVAVERYTVVEPVFCFIVLKPIIKNRYSIIIIIINTVFVYAIYLVIKPFRGA